MLPMLAAASSASGAVVINEVESDAGAGSDFVELFNTGAAAVDISGYVLKDSGEGNNFTVPAGTTIAPGGFYATDVSGLGSSDSARLFAPADGAIPVDSYSWTSHAAATYGRCPDGTGAFTSTSSATKGTANDCPVAASTWPGGSAIGIADGASVFGSNLSGLTYQPSGSGVPGVLWAVRNGPSTLFRLVWDGTKWTPDTANGWSAGKQLFYTDGTGVPDAEGVTLAGGDPNGIFVSTERNDNGADSNTSRPAVLRYDVSSSNTTLNATRDWNLTVDLPGLGANLGLEAVTWVPDDVLVSKGFLDDTATPYNPATYADHGTGLFFVGVEQDGRIIAYALNQTTGAFTRVASIASGFPKVMELQYEPETTHLWAVCDDTCNGRHATLDIAQSGPNDGHFVVTGTFERPGGMPNLNNEGFAIAPQAECVGGLKPVFWADDGNTGSHALRAGTLNCTVPPAGPAPDRDGDGKPDSSDSCPDVAAATADGCPAAPADRDGDGKPDSSDACPDVAAATANGCPAPVGATAGNDTLNGDSGPNVICGLLGNDVINGLQGNDTLFGDACNDKVKVIAARAAVDGNDKLNGAEGNDTLYGAGGMDSLSGGAGNDKLFGGDGNDSLEGGAGNDKLDGGRGNDKLTGGPGVNSYSGGPGNDTVNARNHKKETVDCGSGKKDVATVDKNDKVKGCEKVRRAK